MNHSEDVRSKGIVPVSVTLLFGIFILVAASTMSAPELPKTEKVVIFQKGANTCYYRLDSEDDEELADQDTLHVRPQDRVIFIAQNVDVSVVAVQHKQDGHANNGLRAFSGSPRNSNFFLDEQDGRTKTVNVRTNNGNGKRNHKIEIKCLVGDIAVSSKDTKSGPRALDDVTVRFIPAVPFPTSTGIHGPGEGDIEIPDIDALPDGPMRGEGGPEMEVDP